ncbi:MAG: hypothetical protein PHW65_02490, partial [Dehalococcoidales bacterium]|nr:hypothetical protein [Dehalococcoidales bacterium]
MVKKLPMVVLATLLFWLAWWAVAAISDSALFPTPWETVGALWAILRSPVSWGHIGVSAYRVIVGTAIGSALGAILGLSTRYWSFMATA